MLRPTGHDMKAFITGVINRVVNLANWAVGLVILALAFFALTVAAREDTYYVCEGTYDDRNGHVDSRKAYIKLTEYPFWDPLDSDGVVIIEGDGIYGTYGLAVYKSNNGYYFKDKYALGGYETRASFSGVAHKTLSLNAQSYYYAGDCIRQTQQ